DRGLAPTGFEPFMNNFVLAVPKVINPDKMRTPDEVRNEEFYMIQHFHLPLDVDYLPTTLAIVLFYFGPWGLILGALLLRLTLASVDGGCARKPGPATVIGAVALSVCAMLFEQGVTIYFVTLRGAMALLLFVGLAGFVKRLRVTMAESRLPPTARQAPP